VKAGNYNAPFTFSPADVVPAAALGYKPEKLWSYEAGFKLNSGPLSLNAAAFYYDYKDFQAFVFTTASGVVRNVDSKVYGFDLDASYRVTGALQLGANFAYSHAEIENFEVAPGITRNVRPPYSPRVQATGTIDYTAPVSIGGGDLSFNATVNYAGEIFHNIRNFDVQRFAPRTLVNLSATWDNPGNGLSITVFGKNVFDERYGQIGFDNTTVFGGQNVSYGKPASYGVTLGYKF
jgi:iron complex outermembrane receptor protein